MLIQAIGLALLAAISPTAAAVSAVFLSNAKPQRIVLIFLTGGIVMTAIMAAILFAVLQSGHLYQPAERQPRFGLRLGLGLVMLLAGVYLKVRGPKRPDPAATRNNKGIIARLTARPAPRTAFIVGLLVYTPSLTFVAAVQAVATARQSLPASVAALVLVIVITVAFAWLPLILYLLAPHQTGRMLSGLDGWLRSHGYVLTVAALLIGGLVLAINGALGLTGLVS
jgi:Sap, sulfolipid-1-addressing protein